jgi:hypothetical protein
MRDFHVPKRRDEQIEVVTKTCENGIAHTEVESARFQRSAGTLAYALRRLRLSNTGGWGCPRGAWYRTPINAKDSALFRLS